MNYFFSILFSCLAVANLVAQNRQIEAVAGPAGVYIYMNVTAEGEKPDTIQLAITDHYLVERAVYDSISRKTGEYKTVGKSRPVQNSKELRSFFSDKDIAELRNVFDLANEEELVTFFNTRRNPDAFGPYYLLMATKLATGNIYLDNTAKPGTTYSYRVTRVNKDATTAAGGTAIVKAGAPNPVLEIFKPGSAEVNAGDTVVSFSWKIPVDSLLNHPPAGYSMKQLLVTLNGLKARVMLSAGAGNPYALAANVIATSNDSDGTFNLNYRKRSIPEQQYHAFVLLEDEVGNSSGASDTVLVFSVGPATLPVLQTMNATAVPDGVQLSWPKVIPKAYIVGVKISRYNEEQQLGELALVPVSDTAFVDYSAKPGISYSYLAELQFAHGLGLRQAAPAQAIGAATVFSDPLPPFNARIKNTGESMLLEWDAQKQASIFGYYVYRGTNPNNLELIAGPLKGQLSYLDSARYLSGRSQYFYAVQAENYRQKMSPLSEIVAITPSRAVETVMPKSLDFYYSGKALQIRFPDVREDDNSIVGYLVRGREKGAIGFRFRSTLLSNPNTTDSAAFEYGKTYQYQVAAVSLRGDTSAYSEWYEFFLPKNPVDRMEVFYLRNTSAGVMLSWPQVSYDNRKAYAIYRRTEDEEQYSRIATVPATTFSYTDQSAVAGKVYVYSISVIESDDREGDRGDAKSIRREITKVTTISE
ncbi:MAG: hypothetical protein V4616_12840 [Bacteroidota bacterium]